MMMVWKRDKYLGSLMELREQGRSGAVV